MKKILSTLLVALSSIAALSACSNNRVSAQPATQPENEQLNTTSGKTLVVFFSHAGENYNVGHIEQGNTHIVANLIADAVGATRFEIVPETDYPKDSYDACVAIAKKEKESNARPAIKGDIEVEDYDVVFIGYPNWWGEAPMCVYTFIEQHNWTGKTVIPFITHEGSGMGGTDSKIAAACTGARVLVGKGLAIQGKVAQQDAATTRQLVADWLKTLGFENQQLSN